MKTNLKQIKIFMLSDYNESCDLDEAVNNYVIEAYNRDGNYPQIKTNSKFVSVITDCLVDTTK